MEALTRIRKERGWSQRELARQSGVNPATINQAETGRRTPDIRTLERLAKALRVETADLLGGTTERRGLGMFLEQQLTLTQQIRDAIENAEASVDSNPAYAHRFLAIARQAAELSIEGLKEGLEIEDRRQR